MFKFCRALLLLFFLVSTTASVYAETSWITKKSDKTKVEIKKEKKKKKQYIKFKKKLKKIKEKVVKKSKKKNKVLIKDNEISEEVTAWISKKTKDKFIYTIDALPDGAIYFIAYGLEEIFYGYTLPDEKSDMVKNYYKISNGLAYSSNEKTTCKFSTELLKVDNDEELTGGLFGKCTDGKQLKGTYLQTKNSGQGFATRNQEIFNFQFNTKKKEISKLYDQHLEIKMAGTGGLNNPIKEPQVIVEADGNYYALLIGNSKYKKKWSVLTSPKHDVQDIKKILDEKYNFADVKIVNDATRQKLITSILELKKKVTEKDYVLIYYSGHGEEDEGEHYWIPVEASIENDGTWIDVSLISSYIKKMKAKHILLMTDSCYSEFSGKGIDSNEISNVRLNQDGLNDALNSKARQVLRSGGNYPVPDAQIGNNSLFAYKFIDILRRNNNFITVSSVYAELKNHHRNVKKKDFKNIPKLDEYPEWGHLEGEFIFIAKK